MNDFEIVIDLSHYIVGLKLTRVDAKRLQANIIYKLNKHQRNGSLTYLDETDIMQMVCERIIIGKRKWNKKTNTTPLEFFLSCASSIISAEGKSKRNRQQQKTSDLESNLQIDINTRQPLDDIIKSEGKSELMSDIAESRPALKEIAEQIVVCENVDTQALSGSLNTTVKDIKNKKRVFRRYLTTYLERKS